jgi:hypothetical protein
MSTENKSGTPKGKFLSQGIGTRSLFSCWGTLPYSVLSTDSGSVWTVYHADSVLLIAGATHTRQGHHDLKVNWKQNQPSLPSHGNMHTLLRKSLPQQKIFVLDTLDT